MTTIMFASIFSDLIFKPVSIKVSPDRISLFLKAVLRKRISVIGFILHKVAPHKLVKSFCKWKRLF